MTDNDEPQCEGAHFKPDTQANDVDPRELTEDDLADTTGGRGNFLEAARVWTAYEENKARDAATQALRYPRQ